MIVRTTVKSIQDTMRQDVGVDGDAQRISQLCWMFFLKIIDDQDRDRELFDDAYVSPVPEGRRWRDWATNREGITGETLLDFINTDLFPTLKGLEIGGRGGEKRAVVRSVFEDAYNYMKSGQLVRQRSHAAAAFWRYLRKDFERLAKCRERWRVLYAARGHGLYGGPDRSETLPEFCKHG